MSGVRAFGQASASFDQAYKSGTPITVHGTLSLRVADDFAGRRSDVRYAVRDDATGRSFALHFDRAPRFARSGARITVNGRSHGRDVYALADHTRAYAQTGTGTLSEAAAASSTSSMVTGDQRTLVMLVDFADASVTCTPEAISDLMFSIPSITSVDAMFRGSSFGAVSLSGTVAGSLSIPASASDPCDEEAWADLADSAAAAAGAAPQTYARRLYVMPPNSCPAAGIGDLGGATTRAWVFTCDLPDIYAHELGHNLGLQHASTATSEYGDSSDFMSIGLGRPREVNGPHKAQMGWVPSSAVQAVSEDGMYDLRPLEVAPDASGTLPSMLRIASPDSAGAFYLSYRRPIGVDTDLCCGYVERLNIHRWAGGGARSFLVGTLGDGETFTDPASGLSIKQLGHDDLTSTVRVQMGALCAATPTATLSPQNHSGAAASEAVYSLHLVNNDGASCATSQFSVAGSVPAGWQSVLSQSAVQLTPGSSADLTWRVYSAATAAPGSYAVSVGTTDQQTSIHTASAAGSYTVVQPCIAQPLLNMSPSTQTGSSGSRLSYALSLTNRDTAGCAPTTFVVSPTVPAGWSTSLSATTLTLAPGASGASTLSVTSPAGTSAGTYGVWARVADGTSATHDVTKTGSYTIPAGDTVAPTAPNGLTASIRRKQVTVSWQAAIDNVGVTGYRVIRNGAVIATITATSWIDSTAAAGVAYTYTAVALDAAGNVSPPSNAASVTISGGKK